MTASARPRRLSPDMRRYLGDRDPFGIRPTPEQLILKRRSEARVNPYQSSFQAFMNDLVWTKNEAGGGEVLKFPSAEEWKYLDDCADDLINYPLLMIEKSRRVLASWLVCGFDVWLTSGGQDPRWPALMRSRQNRLVILAALKQKDIQSSSWFLWERVKFIVDQLEARRVRDSWPDFPAWVFTECEAKNSMGGQIHAIASGPDKMRAAGATFIHAEEGAFWPNAKACWAAALPVLKDRDGTYSGHACIVTTAQVNSHCADIALGKAVSVR